MSDKVPSGVFPEGSCPACGNAFRLSHDGLGGSYARELESADEGALDETPQWEIDARPPSDSEECAEVWECTGHGHEMRVQMVVPLDA